MLKYFREQGNKNNFRGQKAGNKFEKGTLSKYLKDQGGKPPFPPGRASSMDRRIYSVGNIVFFCYLACL